MGALGGVSFVSSAPAQQVANPNPLDHEHLFLQDHVAFRFGAQSPVTGVDLARLQRAAEGAGQSTGSCGNDIVESGRVVGVLARRRPVVLANLVMRSKQDRVRLRR
jgi:hypothetical protein